MPWENEFRERMVQFAHSQTGQGEPVSIKIRVSSGCFHREHSPRAYRIIDEYLDEHPPERDGIGYEKHESGPELLVWLALGTAGITITKSIIDLVTTIIKARSEGISKGDGPSAPIELEVRRVEKGDAVAQEMLLRFHPSDAVDADQVEQVLRRALEGAAKVVKKKETGKRTKRSKK